MGSFDFQYFHVYNGEADGATLSAFNNAFNSTMTDGEADNTFEQGDSVFDGNRTGEYVGTIDVNGTSWPVLLFDPGTAFAHLVVYSDRPISPPAVMALNENAVFCFLEGTEVAIRDGLRRVEDLTIGDELRSVDGRSTFVKWIGRQTVSTLFGPAERLMPVRVRAGAVGDGLPVRDLTLTADHALLVDGLLINAGALVNGSTIDYVPLAELGDSYTVYHIETEAHDVILAEGTPAETYIDYVARRAFDNYDEYVALYGEDRTIPEMDHPRISTARMLPSALRTRLRIDRVA